MHCPLMKFFLPESLRVPLVSVPFDFNSAAVSFEHLAVAKNTIYICLFRIQMTMGGKSEIP